MLSDDVLRRPYNKSRHNRALQERIGRSASSIEFKHRNISFILRSVGEDWIRGYLPASNRQGALEDAVERWQERHPEWLMRVPPHPSGLRDSAPLWIGPPPTLTNQPPRENLDRMAAVATKFDAAGRDARNRALGRAGEERVLAHERAALTLAGRDDLARSVRWVAEEEGDGAGYDIASFTPPGRPRLIEVKTTNGWERTPFNLTRNELAVSRERGPDWCLLRLWTSVASRGLSNFFPHWKGTCR